MWTSDIKMYRVAIASQEIRGPHFLFRILLSFLVSTRFFRKVWKIFSLASLK